MNFVRQVLKYHKDDKLTGKLYMYGVKTDSLSWQDVREYKRILDIIARDKIAIFFPREIIKHPTGFSLRGYLICHAKIHSWYHMLKI